MIASVSVEARKHSWIFLTCIFLSGIAAQPALAADCAGHPDALGTSRTLVVDPKQHPRIGTMQYAETLPLDDHEVVLTFDDGPLPRYSDQVLEILASECVKATFFLVGRQASADPEGVRKVRDAGHTVATHTQNHPMGMHRLPVERTSQEIDDGIASITAALGDGTAPAPFFRVPGLARADAIEEHAAALGLQVWSADFPADDWLPVSASRVYDLAIERLEAKGKGVLLLHDIHPRTVTALPRILRELKARGYRIVHVVPATPTRPATPTDPEQWRLHPASETVAISHWPKIPHFVFTRIEMLPAPGLSDLDWRSAGRLARTPPSRGVPLPPESLWPRPLALSQASTPLLPIPAANVFKLQESLRVTLLAANSSVHRSAHAVAVLPKAESLAGAVAGKSRGVVTRQTIRSKPPLTKPNGRALRLASLKKR